MDVSPEATRDAILRAALDAFGSQGYAATSIRDLAARLGITSAALYYHFPSKAAMLEALVTPYVDAVAALLERNPPEDTTTRAAKRALLREYLALLMESAEVADLVGRERALDSHPRLGPRIAGLVEGMVLRLAAPHPDDDAARIRAASAIGALRRPVFRPEIDVEQETREVLAAAMAALGG